MDCAIHGILKARILEWVAFSLLQGIFPNQGSNPGLPHCRWILYQLSHKGSPRILGWVAYPFSSESSWPRNRTGVSYIGGGFFNNWAMREDHWNISRLYFQVLETYSGGVRTDSYRVSLWSDGNVLELGTGDSCTTLWICYKALNHTFQKGCILWYANYVNLKNISLFQHCIRYACKVRLCWLTIPMTLSFSL